MPTQNLLRLLMLLINDEDRVGNSLLQNWKPRFGHNPQLLFSLGQYFKTRFGQDFNFRFSRDADVWLRF